MSDSTNEFVVWDYIVFAATLIVSAAVGIFYAMRGGKQQTTSEFLMADRKMSVVPVALSLLASFNSAIFITGVSAEFYTRGISFIITCVGQVINVFLAAHLYIPIYFDLKLVSVYEYLEMRYKSKAVRIMASIIFVVQMILYQSVVLYAPSLAVNAVTGLDLWIVIVSVGVVCTFYTSVGGLKAVIWTDVFQIFVMIGGVLLTLFLGASKAGGFTKVWEISKDGGRLGGFIFSPDPTIYQSFWNMSIGYCIYWLSFYGVNQVLVQRYCSMPTLKDAQRAIYINAVGLPTVLILCGLCGLAMYAFYIDCDPLAAGYVDAKDQLLPYFVMEVLSWPGVPGIFLASLCSGTLSTVSSGLNSLSAVTWEDALKPKFGYLEEKTQTKITKLLAVVYGILSIGVAFLISGAEGVVQVSMLVNGTVGGPLLGVFTLAIFFPWSNWKGALAGPAVALIVSLWIGGGATLNSDYIVPPYLPTSTDGCYDSNITLTTVATATTTELPDPSGMVKYFYSISYMYYTAVGVIVTILVGVPVSFLTGNTKTSELDQKLIFWAYRKDTLEEECLTRLDQIDIALEKVNPVKLTNFTITSVEETNLGYDDSELHKIKEKHLTEQKQNVYNKTCNST